MALRLVTPETIKKVAQSMPSSARVYARLQGLLRQPNSCLTDIVDIVRVDAGLAAGVLRLGNSVYFRHGEPVESVHEAINRVGMREVNRIVGLTVSGQLFAEKLPLYRLDGETLAQNSLATALAMEFLTRAAAEDERLGYTLGLMRTAGRLALQQLAIMGGAGIPSASPEDGSAPSVLAAWERNYFGVTNVEMSALLLAEWGFEEALCAAVKTHLRPLASTASSKLSSLLHIAGWTAEMLGKGLPGEKGYWNLDDALLAQAGIHENVPQACVMETRSELNRLRVTARPMAAA